jgi:hypothetical protein
MKSKFTKINLFQIQTLRLLAIWKYYLITGLLSTIFILYSITHTDFDAARNWLLGMGHGASEAGVLIKYCMSLPRQVLQSTEIKSVNAARVSGDYMLSRDNWRIGLSAYFASSLGLASFKDTFWTSVENPDHPFYYDCMIGDNSDPNTPWEVIYRYNGYRSKTSTNAYAILEGLLKILLVSILFVI